MKGFVNLSQGAVIEKDGSRYVISNQLDLESVLGKNQETGTSEVIQIKDIRPVSRLNSEENEEHLEVSLINEVDWTEAEGWHGRLRTLLSNSHRTIDDVRKIAAEAGVHIATVYRKLSQLESSGRLSALLKTKPDGGKGKSRLTQEVETVVKTTIDEFYFNKEKKRRTKVETMDEIKHRLLNAKLPLPNPKTVYQRIYQAELGRGISNSSRTDNFDGQVSPIDSLGADYPLAVVQIDHALLDIIVVDDEYHLNCGRPWISAAIDVYSRMVPGFFVSLDPPGNTGAGQCIANSILPKETWLASLDINTPWPCWGLMEKIHADNAGEFRGHMLRRACKEYGIDLEWRPVKKPQYGAHIERLLGTFLKEIHKLPGSTESNPKKRGEYDAEKHAVMTMDALEKWLALYITGVYHQKFHSGIGTSPIKRYEQGIFGTDRLPGRGYPLRVEDHDRLRLDLLPAFKRTIQGYGVVLDVIEYKSGVLKRWEKARDPEKPKELRKFIFKRHPRDISVLYFYDPDLKHYFKVAYRDTSHPPMSIWEYKRVRRHLRLQGVKDINERLIFETYQKMRTVVQEEAQKSKRARRDEQRHSMNRRAKKPDASDALPEGDVVNQDTSSSNLTPRRKVLPFDEIEM